MAVVFAVCFMVGFGSIYWQRHVSSVALTDTIGELDPDEPITQGEINAYLANRARQYEDSVTRAFDDYILRNPHMSDSHELELWNEYKDAALEAYRYINMGGFCGSAAPMGFADFYYDNVDLFRIGFSESADRHGGFSDEIVNREYDRFVHVALPEMTPANEPVDDDEYTLDEQQEKLLKEQSAWSRWIQYREHISDQLRGKEKFRFDNGTNEIRRAKLIQLINRYEYGLMSDDQYEELLHFDCTDAELLGRVGSKASALGERGGLR